MASPPYPPSPSSSSSSNLQSFPGKPSPPARNPSDEGTIERHCRRANPSRWWWQRRLLLPQRPPPLVASTGARPAKRPEKNGIGKAVAAAATVTLIVFCVCRSSSRVSVTTGSSSGGGGGRVDFLLPRWKYGVDKSGGEGGGGGGGGGGGYFSTAVAKAGDAAGRGVGAGAGREKGKQEGAEVKGVEEGQRGEPEDVGMGASVAGIRRSLPEELVHRKKEFGHRHGFNKRKSRCYVLEGEKKTRCHANVYFFGVSKCGTTSLAKWMSLHPQVQWVALPDRHRGSESHVLEDPLLDEKTYGLTGPEAAEADAVLDYTPHYSIVANVPYRIRKSYGEPALNGTVKYIVILREPAARTVSSWQFKYDWHGIEAGAAASFHSERRSLVEVFEDGKRHVDELVECRATHLPPAAGAGPGGAAEVPAEVISDVDMYKCNPHRFMEKNMFLSHVGKSAYFLQLERWIRLFGREHVKVMFLEEMTADPMGALSDVFSFLGLDLLEEEGGKKGLPTRAEWENAVSQNHNLTNEQKKRILDMQVTPEIMQEMREFFAPHNAQLEVLLGRPLPDNWSS